MNSKFKESVIGHLLTNSKYRTMCFQQLIRKGKKELEFHVIFSNNELNIALHMYGFIALQGY